MIKKPITPDQNDNRILVDLRGIAEGLYIIELVTSEGKHLDKMIVAH